MSEQTDKQDIKYVTLNFGGKGFQIARRPIRAAQEWRGALREKLEGAIHDVEALGRLDLGEWQGINVSDVTGIVKAISLRVVDLPQTLLELVQLYARFDDATLAWINEHGYDDEIYDAFGVVMGAVFPFDQIRRVLLAIGPGMGTSPN